MLVVLAILGFAAAAVYILPSAQFSMSNRTVHWLEGCSRQTVEQRIETGQAGL
jgi:type II secretory pathway pseudopilin PulG